MAETTPATMREIFEQVRGDLRMMLDGQAWTLWISGLQPVSYTHGVLVVAAPSESARSWCETRGDRLIRRELRRATERDVQVQYVVQAGVPC